MNTRRENRLEELGRVDAEKAYTRKGKRNLREEKSRIRKELAVGSLVAKHVKRGIEKLSEQQKRGPKLKPRPKAQPRPPKRSRFPEQQKKPRPLGRKKYASGGVVMAGKKVGCQIK
jgi:hypothetical protein